MDLNLGSRSEYLLKIQIVIQERKFAKTKKKQATGREIQLDYSVHTTIRSVIYSHHTVRFQQNERECNRSPEADNFDEEIDGIRGAIRNGRRMWTDTGRTLQTRHSGIKKASHIRKDTGSFKTMRAGIVISS